MNFIGFALLYGLAVTAPALTIGLVGGKAAESDRSPARDGRPHLHPVHPCGRVRRGARAPRLCPWHHVPGKL